MAAHTVVALVLLGLSALTVVLSAVGLAQAPDIVARLHFLTPVTSIAAPLVAGAYLVDRGINLDSGLVLLIVGLLAVTGPPLGSAVARATAEEQEMLPETDAP